MQTDFIKGINFIKYFVGHVSGHDIIPILGA